MHVTWTQSSRSMSINVKLEAIRRMEMDENKGRGQKSFKLLREVFEQIEEIEKKIEKASWWRESQTYSL